jgi:hypothetical protein
VQIGPCRRYQRARSIGQHERQEKFAAPVTPAEQLQRVALKGMARANQNYMFGISVEVVGSLSSASLGRSVMHG